MLRWNEPEQSNQLIWVMSHWGRFLVRHKCRTWDRSDKSITNIWKYPKTYRKE